MLLAIAKKSMLFYAIIINNSALYFDAPDLYNNYFILWNVQGNSNKIPMARVMIDIIKVVKCVVECLVHNRLA